MAVQNVIEAIAPGSAAVDLGGAYSLNVLLQPSNLVFRVHQPVMTGQRLQAQQHVREALAEQRMTVPVAITWRGTSLLRCGNRWAELEEALPHTMPDASFDAYAWLFARMGELHRALHTIRFPIPRPYFAVYGPPGTLRRWLPHTENAVAHHTEAADIARSLHALVGRLARAWIPAKKLPNRLIHGDVKLRNISPGPDGSAVYLDFGFMAQRPRIHEHAYAIARMVLTLHADNPPETFAWQVIPQLLAEYEAAVGERLVSIERQALAPAIAAVALYQAAQSGFMPDPVATMLDDERRRLMRLADWLLSHPDAVVGA